MPNLLRNLTDINRLGIQYRNERLAPLGLRVRHASCLIELCDRPGLSQDQLARRVCIDKSNAARHIAMLEENGYVSRTPSISDKRVMELFPTEKALEILPQLQAVFDEWESCLTNGLSIDEQQQLAQLLDAMKLRARAVMEEETACRS